VANAIEGEVSEAEAKADLDRLEALLREGAVERAVALPEIPAPEVPAPPSLDGPAYRAAVERAKEHIRAGDIFQVVLARRWQTPAASALDALLACFPAGTLSGAPKIRAMEIIDALEPEARGPYAGAVGYASFSGDLDTCITIRTLVVRDGVTSVTAGAGIVAD